jgi:TIR domain
VTTNPDPTFQFDVALSFAGEDREYVNKIADRLRTHDVNVFYDRYEQAILWGKDLYEHLDHVYQRAARYCVLFVSEHYASKVWTNHERKSAQARALRENEEYILPVRFDDTEIPGLRSTVGYIDARTTTPDQLVNLVLQKIQRPSEQTAARTPLRAPRTPEEQRQLLAQRPPAWEYLHFASVLARGKDALEPKWRDHQVRYARRSGLALSGHEIPAFIQEAANELAGHTNNIERILGSKAQERAFGPPGVSGDPVEIEHLGRLLLDVYENLLDWSARVRGTTTSEHFTRLFELLASFADNPINEMRAFIDQYVAEADSLPERLARENHDPIHRAVYLTLTLDKRLGAEYNREMKRLTRRKLFR